MLTEYIHRNPAEVASPLVITSRKPIGSSSKGFISHGIHRTPGPCLVKNLTSIINIDHSTTSVTYSPLTIVSPHQPRPLTPVVTTGWRRLTWGQMLPLSGPDPMRDHLQKDIKSYLLFTFCLSQFNNFVEVFTSCQYVWAAVQINE